jgi:ribosomal protein S18 acetylase RimI-like enzyme
MSTLTAPHLRLAAPADAANLAAFAARTFAETFGSDNRPEDLHAHLTSAFGVAQQTRELNDPKMTTLLMDRGDQLVAFAQLQRNSLPPGIEVDRPLELYRFYVDRPAHGSGVAQQLMAAVHETAHAFGGRHVWLGVWERNPRAIAFYKKVGFIDRGSKEFMVGADRQIDRVLIAPVHRSAPALP